MNISFLTNLIATVVLALGWGLHNDLLMMVGLFALSGALTNWLAVHMLFEKVPGLVGSGVIPARFEEFKTAIKTLMMEQFFTQENIDKPAGYRRAVPASQRGRRVRRYSARRRG